jgi:YggT family protein
MPLLVWLITNVINLLIALLIAGAVLSWFNPDPRHPAVRFVDRVTDPILNPIRRVLGTTGPFDFSPLLAIFLLMLLRNLLVRML